MGKAAPHHLTSLCVALLSLSCHARAVRDADAPAPQAPAAPAAPNRCYPHGKPAVEPPPESAAGDADQSCRPLSEKNLTKAEQQLRRAYRKSFAQSRVVIDFPCDPVEELSDIDVELAEQAGWLTLANFRWHPESRDYEVIAVELRAPREPESLPDYRAASSYGVKTASLTLGASALDLDGVRTPLIATIHEILFAGAMPDVRGFGGGPHIHRLVRMQGRSAHPLAGPSGLEQALRFSAAHFERRYSGEAESQAQQDYLPIELASKPLLAALPPTVFGATIYDAHRRFLRVRFAAGFDAAPEWLKQFYLVLATRLGSAELIPRLVDVARETADSQRVLALGALASITGWDARFDAQGRPRDPSAVARDYAAECSR